MTDTPGTRRSATSFDVARRAGVSRSAVSRAFTPGASISIDTKKKVIEASQDLGYRVNQLARGLSNQRSDLVGLVVAGMDNPFRSTQVDALARELVAKGYRPILFPADSSLDTAQIIQELLQYSLSGLVVTSGTPSTEICSECARIGVPLVLVNRRDDLANADVVIGDNDNGGRLAVAALIQSGCRDLVILQPNHRSFSIDERVKSFTKYANNSDATVEIFDSDSQTYWGGRKTAAQFVERPINRTGVFCPSDYMALGFLDSLKAEHGLVIPRDLCLVGYDDVLQSNWLSNNLTTIRQPVQLLAREVVSMLTARIKEPNREQQTSVVPVEIINRSTTL